MLDRYAACLRLGVSENATTMVCSGGPTANMSLHVSLDFASLWEPCGARFTARTVVPATTKTLRAFLSMLDVDF
jgi:hypothetical protein